jgi:hypothetical protein
MSIPKIIHYCWFGGNEKPALAEKCIKSWKKYCPDYKIIEWNEENYDISASPLYVRQAYEAKKWAFVTDYVRLDVVCRHGGIYLDTDVEVIKSLDPLLNHDCFIGRQPGFQVNTGAGFGCIAEHLVIKIMLDDYKDIPFFKENGKMDLLTCPHRNSTWLFQHGMELANTYQEIAGCAIYPIEFFSPLDAYTRQLSKTSNTYSIHHCDASWKPEETAFRKWKRHLLFDAKSTADYLIHLPNRILQKTLGTEKYNKIKETLKGIFK